MLMVPSTHGVRSCSYSQLLMQTVTRSNSNTLQTCFLEALVSPPSATDAIGAEKPWKEGVKIV